MAIDTRFIKANFRIRAAQIRLIGADGKQIGVVPVKEGLRLAQEEGLDLVEISPNADPPVCKITDLGKYVYTLSKKEKEAKKNQKVIDVKEIKLTAKIEEHDYQTKLRNARRFLERGDKLKLTMMFRGREAAHAHIGEKKLERFKEDVSDLGEVEKNERFGSKMIHLFFAPLSPQKKQSITKGSTNHAENQDSQGST